jgi:predicted ATP-grasp superfamily ATP-dependent carboligase
MATSKPGGVARRADVLISNAWGRSPYNVVRSLALRHLRVAVGTDKFLGMAALSRYAASTFRHPTAVEEPRAFVASIARAIERYNPLVYLPTGEDTYIVAKYADELLAIGTRIPVAPYSTIRTLHRKDTVGALASSLGIPIPRTLRPTSVADVLAFCDEVGSPVVLKRISSSSARGVFYVTRDDVAAMGRGESNGARALEGIVAQEFVHGTGYGVSMLFNHGQLRAKFTHKRLKELPASGGTSVLRMGVVHPLLEEYAERLLASVQFHGVAMVEFKHDERTGQTWLIEVNPRFWGSLALAIHSGVDFPYLLFQMATAGDIEPVLTYRSGVIAKWVLGSAGRPFSRALEANGSESSTRVRPDVYDDLHLDDPLAFIGGLPLAFWKHWVTRTWGHDQLNLNLERLEHTHSSG